MTGKRDADSRFSPAHSPALEPLEPRMLLSVGAVTAVQAGPALFITGGATDDDITLEWTVPGHIVVASGSHTTTTINGLPGPVGFDAVTGDVFVTMNGGVDRVEVVGGTFPGSLTINNGAGDSYTYIDSPATVSGGLTILNGAGNATIWTNGTVVNQSLFIMNGAGNNMINLTQGTLVKGSATVSGGSGMNQFSMANTSIQGSLTLMSGAGPAEVDLTSGSSVAHGASIFNQGGAAFSGGTYAGYTTVFTMAGGSDVSGGLSLFGGAGADGVALTNSTVHGAVLISDGAGAGTFGMSGGGITGSLTFLRGDGGLLPAPWGSWSSLIAENNTSVSGSVTVINGTGTNGVSLGTVTLGSLFAQNGAGAFELVANDATLSGSVTLFASGGATLPAPSATRATATVFSGTSSVGGDFSCFWGAGSDEYSLAGTTFHGNVTLSNGADAALLSATNCNFQHAVTFLRGDGGDLGGSFTGSSSFITLTTCTCGGSWLVSNGSGMDIFRATAVGVTGGLTFLDAAGAAQVMGSALTTTGGLTLIATGGGDLGGTWAGYSTEVDLGGASEIHGDFTYLAGTGNDQLHLDHAGLDGNVLVGAGADGLSVYATASNFAHAVTLLRGDGGSLPSPLGFSSDVYLGTTGCGAMTIVNGAGADQFTDNTGGIYGALFIQDGAGAGSVVLDTTDVHGAMTVMRGDGGDLPPAPGYAGNFSVQYGEIYGATFIMSGSGKEGYGFIGDRLDGAVTVLSGSGDMVFNASQTVCGSSLGVTGSGGASAVSLGDATAMSFHVGGGLSVFTGDGNDTFYLRNVDVSGASTFNSAGGDDHFAVDDSNFTGTVDITTGPAYVPSGTDNDSVDIERASGGTITVFGALLRINGGAGSDAFAVGSGGVLTHARFIKGFEIDGGTGVNTLNYLTGANLFDAGAEQAHPNCTVS